MKSYLMNLKLIILSFFKKIGLLAITKCDIADEKEMEKKKKSLKMDIDTVFISSISGMGIQELKDKLYSKLNN
jgi:GTP-binding protein